MNRYALQTASRALGAAANAANYARRSPALPQGRTNISTSFTGASLLETCCFLRWLYQPDCAVHAEFEAAAAAGGLLGAARLAHKLDAGGLLEKIGSHLIGEGSGMVGWTGGATLS